MSAENALTEKAQVSLVESLCCTFYVSGSCVVFYSEEKAELLRYVLDHKNVPRSMVESAVKDRLMVLGEVMYVEHVRNSTPPDHLGSQSVFGYFLKNKNEGLQRAIQFDHGETAEEYIKSAEGLVDSVIEQLLNYKKPEPVLLGIDDDAHCCCSH